jgi:hypothetical protein
VIGVDQEPPRDVLDVLNAKLGDGKFAIRYEPVDIGVWAVVWLVESRPQRSSRVLFPAGLDRTQTENAWRIFVDQVLKLGESEAETGAELESAGGMDLSGPPAPDDQPAAAAEAPRKKGWFG